MLETTMSEPEFPDSGWKILSSQVVFQGWLTVARDRLRKPDGGETVRSGPTLRCTIRG